MEELRVRNLEELGNILDDETVIQMQQKGKREVKMYMMVQEENDDWWREATPKEKYLISVTDCINEKEYRMLGPDKPIVKGRRCDDGVFYRAANNRNGTYSISADSGKKFVKKIYIRK